MASLKHSWGAKVRIAANDTPTGCAQTEQICWRCWLVKISVQPPHGFPYVAWRRRNNPQQFTGNATPPCVAAESAMGHET